jgi:hypothetical protein
LREKKKPQAAFSLEPGYHEHAGGLLLVAAPQETALITHLAEALPSEQAEGRPPLVGSSAVRRRLLLTLLFLGAVGLHRTWDLRSYTADGLALLTGRKRAYGYRYTEAFLSQVAQFDGAERLTDALTRWTRQLWHPRDDACKSKSALTRLASMVIASLCTAIHAFLLDWLDAWERFFAVEPLSCSTMNKDIPCLPPRTEGISI